MLGCRYFLVTFISSLFISGAAFADFPVQARFTVGSTSVDPQNVNQTLEAQSLKKIDGITQFGVEATYSLVSFLDVGLRYTKRVANNQEFSLSANTDYGAKMEQESMLLLARFPIVKTDILRLDAFAGFGGSNTTLTIRSASQNGDFTSRAAAGWFSTPYAAYGASAAIGYKKVYFVVEGGIESNKVDNFKTSGSVSSSINTLDLSGSYFSIGLLVDGIPGSFKK